MIIPEIYAEHEKNGTHKPLECTGYKVASYPICSCGTLIYWESNEECIVSPMWDKFSVWQERMLNMELHGGHMIPWSRVLENRTRQLKEFLNL